MKVPRETTGIFSRTYREWTQTRRRPSTRSPTHRDWKRRERREELGFASRWSRTTWTSTSESLYPFQPSSCMFLSHSTISRSRLHWATQQHSDYYEEWALLSTQADVEMMLGVLAPLSVVKFKLAFNIPWDSLPTSLEFYAHLQVSILFQTNRVISNLTIWNAAIATSNCKATITTTRNTSKNRVELWSYRFKSTTSKVSIVTFYVTMIDWLIICLICMNDWLLLIRTSISKSDLEQLQATPEV